MTLVMNRRVHRSSEIPCIIGERYLIDGKPECNKKRGGGAKEEGGVISSLHVSSRFCSIWTGSIPFTICTVPS